MMQLLAGLVIFFGCGYFGILLSNKFKKRVRQLVELQHILNELGHSMNFLGMTIANALEYSSKNCNCELKSIFLYVSSRLKDSPGSDMERIWQRAINKYRYSLNLNDDDIEILKDFSKNLGTGNKEKEKNNIKATLMRLKLAENEAVSEQEQNTKMYRGIGFLFGIFVVILLV